MQNAGDTIALLQPSLEVIHVEVTPSPMLDLVELRAQLPAGGGIRIGYLDRAEASKLGQLLLGHVAVLDDAGNPPAINVAEAAEKYSAVLGTTAPDKPAFYWLRDNVSGGEIGPRFETTDEGRRDAEAAAERLNGGSDHPREVAATP